MVTVKNMTSSDIESEFSFSIGKILTPHSVMKNGYFQITSYNNLN